MQLDDPQQYTIDRYSFTRKVVLFNYDLQNSQSASLTISGLVVTFTIYLLTSKSKPQNQKSSYLSSTAPGM